MLRADGFDEAIIGIGNRCGQLDILAYDVNKCIKILMAQGMTEEEAWIVTGKLPSAIQI